MQVRNSIKKLMIKSKLLSFFLFSLLRFINKKSKQELENRKTISLFEYNCLAKPFKLYPVYNIMDNNIYGTGKIISKIGLDPNDSLAEHGLIFGTLVQKHNIYSFVKNIITFSRYRENILKRNVFDKNIVCVGPYILHVDSLLSSYDLLKLKRKLGRVLTVFPSHSIESITSQYSVQEFCDEIEKVRSSFQFDSVIICLYWKDIQIGLSKEYVERGYKVTTAGYKYDFYFLNRLKSIILLSDFTMSNNIGTHIGYCICLKKGHYLIDQAKTIISHKDAEREINQRGKVEQSSYEEAVNEIKKAFNVIHLEPTASQRMIVNTYWGYENG